MPTAGITARLPGKIGANLPTAEGLIEFQLCVEAEFRRLMCSSKKGGVIKKKKKDYVPKG